ncbi:MAG: hypothetical protein K2H47_02175 [Muribaculaceae bacterium]|nr:hypothetical protein [Muribaculaceae bacterium]
MKFLKTYITALPLALLLLTGAGVVTLSSCSDNKEQELSPGKGDALSIRVLDEGKDLPNKLLSIGSGLSRTTLSVVTNTRWSVEITECDGSWCSVLFNDGQTINVNNGEFVLETAANRSETEQRSCKVTVYAIDIKGNRVPNEAYTFTVQQENQRIMINNPTPAPWPGIGGNDNFTVTSNLPWRVSLSDPMTADNGYMEIIPGSGMTPGADGSWQFDPKTTEAGSAPSEAVRVSFDVRMSMNSTGSPRHGELVISSPDNSFMPVTVPLEQREITASFTVSPTHLDFIPATGEIFHFTIYSPTQDWSVSLMPEDTKWLSVTPAAGSSTGLNTSEITVVVEPNETPRLREVTFHFQSDNGDEVFVNLQQVYGAEMPDIPTEPVLSMPWISAEGWTQTTATLNAYYFSPVAELTSCGAFITPADDSGTTETIEGEFIGDSKITVSFEGLIPGTQYRAQPFVRYTQNGVERRQSGEEITFTTPEYTPGNGDNPPPVVNPAPAKK